MKKQCDQSKKEVDSFECSNYYIDPYRETTSELNEVFPSKQASHLDMLLIVKDDGIGTTGAALSGTLVINFFKSLAEKEPYPKVIIFMNRGILLTIEDSSCLSSLRELESKGVLILSNFTCLDYHKVMDKLAVGGVTNMYNIVELMKLSKNTITL
ncbi:MULTISPECIES: sulfurtransferase-like selenium metabolism protein YedF [unclassified Fusibacter]|uniref:sulfurtransferase-like selenium metabolism protein YedF n=1 Tax=unclassified Fusibacter TaxID=2624464 RepID=UPI0010104F52|nr:MULTISPECIES: sulfurtransferase-like selenium metabolism protein YedF [unclassified Fusibacter]MCK8060873.1 sulfurtransferase-like selenium metabolism protein YedF [Fusibacter sp. A2]NPE23169.1 sulfurtransferase-like selenium metabolism protein YedF [Fusibacter sp. A1]RXV59527.1 sulfurtransferase-like selenium metabolism protein YedF [Fusibacter sp. A1]